MQDELILVDCYSWIENTREKLLSFDCGVKAINDEIIKIFDKNEDKRVLLLVDKSNNILGVIAFSLATTSLIQNGESPITKFPVLNIDLLGVDEKWKKKKVGTQLVVVALRMALSIDYLAPLNGVHLEALEDAVEFYESLGFEDLGSYYIGRKSTQMFFSMKRLRRTPIVFYLDPYNMKD